MRDWLEVMKVAAFFVLALTVRLVKNPSTLYRWLAVGQPNCAGCQYRLRQTLSSRPAGSSRFAACFLQIHVNLMRELLMPASGVSFLASALMADYSQRLDLPLILKSWLWRRLLTVEEARSLGIQTDISAVVALALPILRNQQGGDRDYLNDWGNLLCKASCLRPLLMVELLASGGVRHPLDAPLS